MDITKINNPCEPCERCCESFLSNGSRCNYLNLITIKLCVNNVNHFHARAHVCDIFNIFPSFFKTLAKYKNTLTREFYIKTIHIIHIVFNLLIYKYFICEASIKNDSRTIHIIHI